MKRKIKSLGFSIMFIAPLLGISQTSWKSDPNHSSLQFSVIHLAISEVNGQFDEFDIEMKAGNEDFSNAEVSLVAKTGSIDTGVSGRDKHLKSDDFFDVEKYPEITFKSKRVVKKGGKRYNLIGDLTMKDVTKEITLELMHIGTVSRQNGEVKAGFKVTGKLNRMDFNVNGGSISVSDDVEIEGNIQMKKQ